MVNEKKKVLLENIEEPVEKKAVILAGLEEKVDDIKETAEKAADFVGDAAKGVGDFAGKQLNIAKGILGRVSEDLEEQRRKQRFDKYRPIFTGTLDEGSLLFPEMINLVDSDKRLEIADFKEALGYQQTINKQDLLDIYKKDADKFNITFYPEKNISIYYVHPLDSTMYIDIREYFKFLKEARVAELESIAQDLGAKHFKVSIMEESSTNSIKKDKGEAKFGLGKDKANAKVEVENSEKKYNFVGVAAESTFPGKDPVEPVLQFWKNNIAINTLVKQRLSKDNPLTSKTYRLDYNISTGIKEKEAAKIDGVLKTLKFSGAGSISEEVKNESKKRFEFTIDF